MNERDTPCVLAVCGSLRTESKTRVALEELLSASEQAGARTDLVDLRSVDLPSLHATDEPVPDAERLQSRITRADSVVLGTPNYHGSFSGALKNALDYCGRDEFAETTVGLLEVAAGEFPGSALTHLRAVSRTLHGWTLPTEVAIPNSHSLITADGITDRKIAERTHKLGTELVEYAGMATYPETVDSVEAEQ